MPAGDSQKTTVTRGDISSASISSASISSVRLSFVAEMGGGARRGGAKRREQGLKKKTSELATLCGVDVCLLGVDPDGHLFFWPPDVSEFRRISQRYLDAVGGGSHHPGPGAPPPAKKRKRVPFSTPNKKRCQAQQQQDQAPLLPLPSSSSSAVAAVELHSQELPLPMPMVDGSADFPILGLPCVGPDVTDPVELGLFAPPAPLLPLPSYFSAAAAAAAVELHSQELPLPMPMVDSSADFPILGLPCVGLTDPVDLGLFAPPAPAPWMHMGRPLERPDGGRSSPSLLPSSDPPAHLPAAEFHVYNMDPLEMATELGSCELISLIPCFASSFHSTDPQFIMY